jgi:hypothetical protein
VIFPIRDDDGCTLYVTGCCTQQNTLRRETHKIQIAQECATLGIRREVRQGETIVSTVLAEFTASMLRSPARVGISIGKSSFDFYCVIAGPDLAS